MQDDMYLISEDGWVASPYRIVEKNKKTGKETDKGWTCDLIPPSLLIDQFFSEEKSALQAIEAERETIAAQIAELEEEQSGEDGVFADFEKVNKAAVTKRLKELSKSAKDEISILKQYLDLSEKIFSVNADIKNASEVLDIKAFAQYRKLSPEEVKQIVIEAKWMASMSIAIKDEMDRISQRLTVRINELMERYDMPFPQIDKELSDLEAKVNAHLQKMGYVW
jgi:type I restriction enzyme M protein